MPNDDQFPMLAPHTFGVKPKEKEQDLEIDDEEESTGEPPTAVEEDRFAIEIERILTVESPAVRDTIKRTECFGHGFYIDPVDVPEGDEGGICLQTDCDLYGLCRLVWNRASDEAKAPDQTTETVKERKVFTLDGMRERHPYVHAGRPVDDLAKNIWEMVGQPPMINNNWNYPPSRTATEKKAAAKVFTDRWGGGLVISRRINYHQYFLDGVHLLRFWTRTAGGGWLDLNPSIAKALLKLGEIDVQETPKRSDGETNRRYRFYPYRCWVSRRRHLNRLRRAFEAYGILAVEENPGGTK